LAQGIGNIKGTNTVFFVPKTEILMDKRRKTTHERVVVAYKPDNLE
jgi:hypothetical protein